MQTKNLPRGLRNCNPLNIRISSSKWKGAVPADQRTDKSFEQFTSMCWGVRAACILIHKYITVYRLKSIGEIISRWAPAGDGNNNPKSYAQKVAAYLHGTVDDEVRFNDGARIVGLIYYMALIENGEPVSLGEVIEGYRMACNDMQIVFPEDAA